MVGRRGSAGCREATIPPENGRPIYHFFAAKARRNGTIALISSAESLSLNAGILVFRTPLVMASTISSSVVCFCHFGLVKSWALYCRPFLVCAFPFAPWQNVLRFSQTSCGVCGPTTGTGGGVMGWARA